jgi:hypothetical protein
MADVSDGGKQVALALLASSTQGTEIWVRRATICVLAAFVLAGLLNVFGQRPRSDVVSRSGTTLTVSASSAVRGGLFFQARFEITARDQLQNPILVLSHGWFDSITVNTMTPGPEGERSEREGIAFTYPPLAANRSLTAFIQFQVNPTAVGRKKQTVELRDGRRVIARLDRSLMVFP